MKYCGWVIVGVGSESHMVTRLHWCGGRHVKPGNSISNVISDLARHTCGCATLAHPQLS